MCPVIGLSLPLLMKLILSSQQHLGENVVRTIAMDGKKLPPPLSSSPSCPFSPHRGIHTPIGPDKPLQRTPSR